MNKTELINYLADHRKYKRYLEIGMHAEEDNFKHVRCAHKVRITSGVTGNDEEINDTRLEQTGNKFDVIFIDGIHTEAQVLNDIDLALKYIDAGGTIIIHDCLPPDAWHQRELAEYHPGENWNGTTWKAVLRVFNQTIHKCSIIDTDWGCGIIDTSSRQAPINRDLPGTLDYERHYKWLLTYKISVAAFIRDQIKVFYHVACMGNWQQVFYEQLQQLRKNGFLNLNLTVLGSRQELATLREINAEFRMNVNILFSSCQLSHFERPALLAIEKYAKENNGYVLYLHTKGVSSPGDETKIKWRRLMMRELVEKWESCMLQLLAYDIIGVNWREMPPVSHYCGNFWYASTRYLRKLANFDPYYQNPLFQIWDEINHKRLGCEFWIGSAAQKPNLLSLFCKDVDFCNKDYWKDKYRYEQRLAVSRR